MPDTTLTCGDCGNTFEWSEGEREFYATKGFDAPKRCKSCRDKRKKRFGDKRGGNAAVEAVRKGSHGRSEQPVRSGNR